MEFLAFWLVVGVIVAIVVAYNRAKQRELDQARSSYQDSLARLKTDPTNPDLKQKTLALGRTYSNLTRNSKGVTIFDEVALSNDINAACAAASVRSARDQRNSPEERLSKLADLRRKGLVSEDEYQTRRTRILEEL
jgi:hypothetical protein